ncbi:conjugal transfer protein TraL [Pandoraea cepalis]|uniref:Conjugal transfer protein TraL n=1 Tax=Pandoraea cepalis TaxID=2508294 RepID=A0AAW7MHD9_9BURK|nr:conjugal transfer protein TraL [Pandoraea cepalis]MDN4572055.1 conjugal transfer protein TraL [Pandoraea cepalis]MDN4578901.1 conjugal transfer protein TraL [Pandoraea cepalis]
MTTEQKLTDAGQDAIHFFLQGKGGVGKSTCASTLSQYFETLKRKPLLRDTDPINQTLASYKALGAKHVEVMTSDNAIDTRRFDGLVEEVVAFEGPVVVDNGASTFVPLTGYMVENGVIDVLQGMGKKVYIHSVITGGQAMEETIKGLNTMLKVQACPIVVWENEFFGLVQKDGKSFRESALYKENKGRIKGVITVEKRNADTFGKDVELMMNEKLTYEEALNSDAFGLMARQRLKLVRTALFEQLDALEL